jgi:hypothetical protein
MLRRRCFTAAVTGALPRSAAAGFGLPISPDPAADGIRARTRADVKPIGIDRPHHGELAEPPPADAPEAVPFAFDARTLFRELLRARPPPPSAASPLRRLKKR